MILLGFYLYIFVFQEFFIRLILIFLVYLDIINDIQKNVLSFLKEEAKSEENMLILENKLKNSTISDRHSISRI